MRLSDILAALPPETQLTFRAGELRELLDKEIRTHDVSWVNITRASELTGIQPRTLRKNAEKWARNYERGLTVPIRVCKKGDSENAHWLFAEQDCEQYRRPEPVPQSNIPVVDPEETLRSYWGHKFTAR